MGDVFEFSGGGWRIATDGMDGWDEGVWARWLAEGKGCHRWHGWVGTRVVARQAR